jgi:hypothetical protein
MNFRVRYLTVFGVPAAPSEIQGHAGTESGQHVIADTLRASSRRRAHPQALLGTGVAVATTSHTSRGGRWGTESPTAVHEATVPLTLRAARGNCPP